MATRSTIALEFADGTVQQVYCHWDGYPEYNGKLLLKHYSNPFILRDLIDLGDLSSLQPTIGVKHPFSNHDAGMTRQEYDELYEGMCTFYGRDRGESNTNARKFKCFEDYEKHHQYEEYEYILRNDGRWYVSDHERVYVELESVIELEKEQ